MPIGACAIVLAGLCLPAPYQHAASYGSALSDICDVKPHHCYSHVDPRWARRLGVQIDTYETDDMEAKVSTGLPRACQGDVCVLYLRACTADGLECEYDWGKLYAPSPGNLDGTVFYNVVFRLKAKSAAAMKRAVANLSVEVTTNKEPTLVPVSSMTVASASRYDPACDEPHAPDACPNLMYGRVPRAVLTREQRFSLAPGEFARGD
jgi:hypothetical protein